MLISILVLLLGGSVVLNVLLFYKILVFNEDIENKVQEIRRLRYIVDNPLPKHSLKNNEV